MPLVLGVDSSTQSTKALLVDADSGEVVEQRAARHPDGTAVDPRRWLEAFDEAAGPLLERADAVAIGGQQHGSVVLDAAGDPVHDALLWNDMRSAGAAADLVEELGGPQASADLTGSVLNASITVTKLRWMRDHAADALGRAHRVLLPHDYLTWHLAGRPEEATTDRGDASGTGYFSPHTDDWMPEVLERAAGRSLVLPRIAEPAEVVGHHGRAVIAPGTGDNMAAALGLGLKQGDAGVSIGTSGVVSMVAAGPSADGTGMVAGFADATGRFLPLACTVNAARILDLGARLLGVDHAGLAELALASVPGAHGLTLLPYLDGERTPARPDAAGTLHGLTSATTREDLARAHVEGLLLSLADALAAMDAMSDASPARALLIGGAARNPAVRALAPAVLGLPVALPDPGEYVALGAARQAAWTLLGTETPPDWPVPATELDGPEDGPDAGELRAAYADLRERTAGWSTPS
ncbi:xylulose kinase [Marmoricola sp. Leaf446]|uniref:xylulokinase n=1 Tax=Marmoricola sp. Leaf446 TaxID=1736379 RepID=UPI0006FED033|nr:xylulokinase [Marmoricola sp. Leaf446]KQT94074.1 xylulose kinase [Marmoricola sp. Leaf446]